METKDVKNQQSAGDEAQKQADKLLKDGLKRAAEVCKEAKKQADIVYKEAKKLAVDKTAKQQAEQAHKEALKEAEKVRDAIVGQIWAVWNTSWDQRA